MSSDQIQKQIETISRVTKEACKSKESALAFLVAAGIIERMGTMEQPDNEMMEVLNKTSKRLLSKTPTKL